MESVLKVLKELGIPYQAFEHPAVFTVAESEKYDLDIPGGKTKNLFLRNKQADQYYLVIMEGKKRADLKKLAELLGEKRLSFGSSEKLDEILGLTPGSVSPFGLINDLEKRVIVVVDEDLLEHELVGFHPNINTQTLVISKMDFKKYLEWCGHKVWIERL